MPAFTPPRSRVTRTRTTGLLLAISTALGSAHAGYTVIEDDLLPTSALEARNAALMGRLPTFPDEYRIGFGLRRTALGPNGRTAVNALLPLLRDAASIRIVGRPDSVANSTLARDRAAGLRTHLQRLGVPSDRILVEIDNSPNIATEPGVFPVDLYVVRGTVIPSLHAQDYVAPQPRLGTRSLAQKYQMQTADERSGYSRPSPRNVPASTSPPVTPAPTGSSPGDAAVLAYITAAVASGQMNTNTALVLLRALAANAGPSAASRSPSGPPAPGALNQAIASPAPTNWLLDRQLSLFDNLDRWVRTAGWHPIQWSAAAQEMSHTFQVTQSVTVPGSFPEVLRRVAEVTGLNICALPRLQLVRITESSVPCNP